MDHQVGMRILHGITDLRQQFQRLLTAQPLLAAVGKKWLAIHVLHHEVGHSRGGLSPFKQTRDVRVLQVR